MDVRDDETYKAGHLADSQQVNLKEIESADAQTAMFELAGKLDKEKPVYFLCYSGNKCAKTGISVLKDAGFISLRMVQKTEMFLQHLKNKINNKERA